jgi:mono/diheme cytochrome c family protein
MRWSGATAALLVANLLSLPRAGAAEPTDQFETNVRPLLLKHCVPCHGPEKQKGGLRLDSKAGWQTGGENGPAVTPGKPDDSPLIKAVQGAGGVARMPPNGKLTAAEIAALVQWVKDGAVDPRDGGPARLGGVAREEALKWWSFRPVVRPEPPPTKSRPANPIDRFILAQLEAKGLAPSAPADRRTLIRRATYDLTGLPPTPDEVDAFVRDAAPDAYEKLIDRLLASAAYGERWGRHWLDLVRYADTAGDNSDHPLPHAWRYRNWVIDAFNRDTPYDEFLRDQLAGDIRAARGPSEAHAQRIVATGFLALARRFGHDIDKDMHLTHEDTIDTVGKALLGLTIGCARCHDHKYDAISARDYYALYGIFDSTRFAFPGCEAKQQPRDLVPLVPRAERERALKPFEEKRADLDARIGWLRAEEADRARRLKAAAAKAGSPLAAGEIPDGGEQDFGKLPERVAVKAGQFLQLSVDPLKNHGADSTLVEWSIAEIGGKGRTWDLAADVLDDFLAANPHADSHGNKRTWWFLDARGGQRPLPESVRDVQGKPGLHAWRNGDTPSVFVNASKEPISVWTKLPARSVFVHPAADGRVALGWLSPIDGAVRISGRVKDAHPGGPDGVRWVIERFEPELGTDLLALAAASERRAALERERAALDASLPREEVAFAVTEGTPHDVKMHLRGDPEKPGPVVARRWLEVFGGAPLPASAGSGRLELAEWIASPSNPLTARVMVNRIWLHHFGTGLVKTPNDFGTRGAAPTHPELLDWLAAEFTEPGEPGQPAGRSPPKRAWSVKALHRLIMLSATYRQAGAARPEAAEIDPNNDLLWRFPRRRMSAEELRDTLLATSGQLDRTPGGPHPFPPETNWNYSQHVPFGSTYDSDKRSVYLVVLRNRRHPFLGLFDGADPNATTPQRQTTTVPTQALYFLNDPFFHAQAGKVATRALAKADDAARLDELFRLALQRRPGPNEREVATAFLARYTAALTGAPAERDKAAWAALARVILASNEFLYLD